MNIKEVNFKNYIEVRSPGEVALICRRIIDHNPLPGPEETYYNYRFHLDDEDARAESDLRIVGAIIDGTVVEESEYPIFVDEFEIAGILLANSQTLEFVCKKHNSPKN